MGVIIWVAEGASEFLLSDAGDLGLPIATWHPTQTGQKLGGKQKPRGKGR